jgi:hypothetical protein
MRWSVDCSRGLTSTPFRTLSPSQTGAPAAQQHRALDPRYAAPDPRHPQQGGYPQPQHAGGGHCPHHKKKREGFLSDLFDFD